MRTKAVALSAILTVGILFGLSAIQAQGTGGEQEQREQAGDAAQPVGQQLFAQNCAGCHGAEGGGGYGPKFSGNGNLEDAVHVITQIEEGGGRMPAFGNELSDAQIAAVATYIRTSWGNDFGEITEQQVAQQEQLQTAGQAETIGVATVATAQSDSIGSYLVDANGRTLYYFRNDAPQGTSHCYHPCTNRWVPLLTSGGPEAGQGVDASQLATIQREDDTAQVTFKGWPLYYFVGDEASGDAKGAEISDVWQVASPDLPAVEEGAGAQQDQQDGNRAN